MKIIKIIERNLTPDDNGDFKVYCQALFGNTYRYVSVLFDSIESARGINAGDYVDAENARIIYNTKTSVKP